jgi:predicted DNA-binding antitoxin AbrB/MazE fold protein
MTHVTEAIFTQGILKVVGHLELPEEQRVRVIIEPINGGEQGDRAAALKRLIAGIETMDFRSRGRLPSRDELHDRP